MKTTVIGRLNYIKSSQAPSSAKTPLGSSSINSLYVTKEKTIKNGREQDFNLEDDGFELLKGISLNFPRSQYPDKRKLFYATQELFGPLATRIVKERFGLDDYSIFAWYLVPPFIRVASSDTTDSYTDHSHGTRPHAMVHNDYGFNYLDYLKSLCPDDLNRKNKVKAAEVCRNYQSAGRVIVLQFWTSAQPEGTVIENDTLALCHPRSVRVSDLVTRPLANYAGIKSKDNTVILQAKDSPRHEWFYWPDLKTGDECLCWIGYDSAWPEMRPCFHSSFHNPMVPSTAHKRESLECRVILLLDEKLRAKL